MSDVKIRLTAYDKVSLSMPVLQEANLCICPVEMTGMKFSLLILLVVKVINVVALNQKGLLDIFGALVPLINADASYNDWWRILDIERLILGFLGSIISTIANFQMAYLVANLD